MHMKTQFPVVHSDAFLNFSGNWYDESPLPTTTNKNEFDFIEVEAIKVDRKAEEMWAYMKGYN